MKTKQAITISLLLAISLIAQNIPLGTILSSSLKFTAFDIVAPILGQLLGIMAIPIIIITQVYNLITHQELTFTTIHAARLLTPLVATLYFAKNTRMNYILPTICILLFVAHPIGRTAWYFSLFWTIPIITNQFRNNIFAKSLGATFSAHAVGGVIWLYSLSLPASFWQSLIPIVAIERIIMAAGITLMYYATNKLTLSIKNRHSIKQSEKATA